MYYMYMYIQLPRISSLTLQVYILEFTIEKNELPSNQREQAPKEEKKSARVSSLNSSEYFPRVKFFLFFYIYSKIAI